MKGSLKRASELISAVAGRPLKREERVEKTIDLAAHLIHATIHETTFKEKKREAWLGRMMEDPKGRMFITAMTDQCFRSRSNARTADQLLYLLKKYGIPQFLKENDRMKFLVFRLFGAFLSPFFIPIIRRQVRKELADVLLPEDPKEQQNYFRKCREENVRINLNHLGEAILGEEEAERRLNLYLNDLKDPNIEYISIKISTVFSQINMLGFDESLEILAEKLRLLYRTAMKHHYQRSDGSETEKFVNLDMEEYKDLDLTVSLFQKVLSEPEFLRHQAGIVLQSYLPDSYPVLQSLTKWAMERVEKGGMPIKIRIVKGANLAMEAVESSIRGWEQAPFEGKSQSDANFKRMLEFSTQPEHAKGVHIGVGSHNLFDIAYVLLLRSERGTENEITFEMLEGMAEPMRRVIHKLSGQMLLYCPEAKEKDFQNAVSYLIRRLDENSGPENFLRHFYQIRPENWAWNDEVERFQNSIQLIDSLSSSRRRKQNRETSPLKHQDEEPFKNEPDTDFSLRENREWAEKIFKEWEEKKFPNIPLVIAGEDLEGKLKPGIDPSRPHTPLYHYTLAEKEHIDRALTCAKEQGKRWGKMPFEERSLLLGRAAQAFRERQKELIGAMIADGGKSIWEADPEVSEAVDFIEYYRKNWEKILSLSDLQWEPKGSVLVAPPWNFPCSIPAGGIAAALTAGNCVLFKPAPEAVLVGWYLVQAFWTGGIPKEVLQFINCEEETIGSYLVKHPDLSTVILTGATATAKKLLSLRPGLDLHAETGGKNVMIITSMCDRDLAIRDLVQSAFGHSGQKCSACSLAILERELFDDPNFKRQLLDAASSLKVASAWNPSSKVTPLIRPPEDPLKRGLTTLEKGESWLLKPQADPENPHLWSPGIKWAVKENSFTHQTELFGPVLGVMRAESLDEAIRIANGTPYGLTSGLHSLDEREQAYWKERIVAGNLYINRGITGAIVRRQPFGGCKASCFGPGAKTGGPNYTFQLAKARQITLPHERASLPPSTISLISALKLNEEEREIWKKSAESYAYWAQILKEPTDPSSLLGQDNYFYHIPLEKAFLRFEEREPTLPLFQAVAACLICQTPLEISSSHPLPVLEKIPGVSLKVEEERMLLERSPRRIRLLAPPSESLKNKAAAKGIILQDEPLLSNGRFELLHYLREVALSVDYHRYGYLGLRDS